MSSILQIRDLCKDYRSDWTFRATRVLSSLSLEVHDGECFGLLGPNGAGKTTTFKLVLGFLRPTSGEVLFDGSPLSTGARAQIGFLPEHPYFYDYLTVDETLHLFAALYGIPRSQRRSRVSEVVDRVGMEHRRRYALRNLSKGMLQRVGVAQAILNRPRLLVLDEPMSGLDPLGRRHMRELIKSLRDAGTSIVFSSHILSDAEAVCDRVGILTDGRLREILRVADHSDADHFELAFRSPGDELRAALQELSPNPIVSNGATCTAILESRDLVDRAVDLARRHNVSIEKLQPRHTSLEEEFVRHVGTTAQPD